MENVAELIKNTRKKLGITQHEFAERVGSKRNNIAKYETGRAMPSGSFILKVIKLRD